MFGVSEITGQMQFTIDENNILGDYVISTDGSIRFEFESQFMAMELMKVLADFHLPKIAMTVAPSPEEDAK